MNETIKNTIRALQRNNMAGYFVNNTQELFDLLSKLITTGSKVGCSKSSTLEEAGVYTLLRRSNCIYFDSQRKELSETDRKELQLRNLTVDTYITSTNALTINGELYNIDYDGSRLAPLIYGPKQVIIIAGINKLTTSIEQAIKRARQTAAPLDAIELGVHTPCSELGYCINCRHLERICSNFLFVAHQAIKDRIQVIIVNETLGH